MGKNEFKYPLEVLHNEKLSWKARGIYGFVLSKNLKIFSVYDFINSNAGITSIESGLNELLKNGHIKQVHDSIKVYSLLEATIEITNQSGFLYVLGDNYGNYKIGITKDVAKRLSTYKTHMPYDPVIIKIVFCNGVRSVEKAIHNKFKSNRLNGEWFKLGQDDLLYLNDFLGGKANA